MTFGAAAAATIAVSIWAFVAWGVPQPANRPFARRPGHARWLQAWSWWDGAWYIAVARRGYVAVSGRQSAVAFFPAYPLATRALAAAAGNPIVAGARLTLSCGAVAAVLFHRWCLRFLGAPEARWTVACLVLYPCAFYLMGTVYGDAMFLAAAMGAFLMLEADRPLAAGLAAALATATRPLGIAVVIGLWLRGYERGSWRRHRGR